MKRTNKILKLSLALLLMLGAALLLTACGGGASYSDASGDVGVLEWTYDAETKTLTIEGDEAGVIPDADSSADVPWYAIRGGVTKIEMDETVTAIGDYAFYGMAALKDVEMTDAITEIGDYAFAFSGIENIELHEGLSTVGDSAFEACDSLTEIVLPLTVESIGARCFAFCSSMTDAVVVSPIEEIPEEAFLQCIKLDNLVLNPAMSGEDAPIADTAFDGTAYALSADEPSSPSYREDKVEQYAVTISYVYEDGSKAAESYTDIVVNGYTGTRRSPTVEGYEPDVLLVQIEVDGEDFSKEVVYTPVEAEETTDEVVETEPVEAEEDEGFTVGTAIAIVVLVVVIAAIVIGGILLVRMDKKDQKGKNAPKKGNNKKK